MVHTKNKISKLRQVKVSAIRITSNDCSSYCAIESGQYRLGKHFVMNLMVSLSVGLLVFMSPEAATTKPWRELFKSPMFRKHLVLLAVDEAHCISEWYVCVWETFIAY